MYRKFAVAAALVACINVTSAFAVEGRHKLMVLAFGDDEFAIVDLAKDSGKVVSFQEQILPECKAGSVSEKDGVVSVELNHTGGSGTFTGKADGKGVIKGIFQFRGNPYPAELVKTDADKVAELQSGKVARDLNAALRANAGKPSNVIRGLIEEAIAKNEGKPYLNSVYGRYLNSADQLGLTEQEVRKTLDNWFSMAKSYGDAWFAQSRKLAMAAMKGQKSAAASLLELAQEAEKSIDEEKDMEGKVEALAMIASAAAASNKKDLVDTVNQRLQGYESRLDDNYKKNVPPFKPEKVAEKSGVRPVVMELFTGAQCPPCVAADVAFDALGDTYSPANVILLQYHLHIPGADPMTNPDSLDRQKYYSEDVRGTPSTFFNGNSEAGGGGNMGMSEGKYKQYRGLIDRLLDKKPAATVNLNATRKGETIEIEASAKLADKPGEKSKPTLRLVLTEEIVKYVGGNKLRFHHHVVRDMPGGAQGTALNASGEATKKMTLNLDTLRGEIESYLSDYEKTRKFAGTKPASDLKHVSVVAFVQDDETREILGAAQIEVKEKP